MTTGCYRSRSSSVLKNSLSAGAHALLLNPKPPSISAEWAVGNQVPNALNAGTFKNSLLFRRKVSVKCASLMPNLYQFEQNDHFYVTFSKRGPFYLAHTHHPCLLPPDN